MMKKFISILASIICIFTYIYQSATYASENQAFCRCEPNQSCWPSENDWLGLQKQLKGKLIKPRSLLAACKVNAESDACKTALKNIHNPFFNEANPAGTQSQGWAGAWKNELSTYAVEAKTTKDIVAAVNFAREHKIKLAIKGTGHDYLGRSNAANSLLIWTHQMRDINIDNNFIPAGCVNEKGVSAISIGAGTRWLDVYREATTKHNRYVQGGGCTSVGAAGGFTQGGGFGSFSKKYGTAASNILQVEIVTANGDIMISNKCQNQDLFWAIRGGGGGTFGVVTKMTLKTHELPSHFGLVQATLSAKDDVSYKKLLQQFLIFYRDNLNNEHWGEQITFDAKNTIHVYLVFETLTENQVETLWKPLKEWIEKMEIMTIPARQMWNVEYWEKNHPGFITLDKTTNAEKNNFWWTSNSNEFPMYWYTYQSWWLPLSLFEGKNIANLTDTFFKASRLTPVTLHINKGLAGGDIDAIHRSQETATNPSAFTSAGLIIMGSGSNKVYLDAQQQKPDMQKISRAMEYFLNAAPHAGSYVNETDYFQKNWQKAFWGENYEKLFAIKNKYDPEGVFYCHHCVGSERWNDNGVCLKK